MVYFFMASLNLKPCFLDKLSSSLPCDTAASNTEISCLSSLTYFRNFTISAICSSETAFKLAIRHWRSLICLIDWETDAFFNSCICREFVICLRFGSLALFPVYYGLFACFSYTSRKIWHLGFAFAAFSWVAFSFSSLDFVPCHLISSVHLL